MDFRRVKWGPDEAKGDSNLRRYFVKIPQYDGLVTGQYRYVIGRKGTGKTALAERIRIRLLGDPHAFYINFSLRNFPLPILEKLKQESMADKSQYVAVWKFLMAVEVARMVLCDNGAGPSENVAELRDFLTLNFPQEGASFAHTLEFLREKEAKVTVALDWVSGLFGRKRAEKVTTSVAYHQITETLLEKISSISSESSYHMFMDELDEGYQAGDNNLRLILLGLLRATEDTFLYLDQAGFRFRPVVLLRSDIFDRLDDNDINKLDDYVVRLKWFGESRSAFSLKRIVDARIRASLRVSGNDLWHHIAEDRDKDTPGSVGTLWKYMSNRTFERPRDIIKFMKICSKYQPSGKLTFAAVSQGENEFSSWLYKELSNEIHSYLPIWREALHCITRVGRTPFTQSQYDQELRRDPAIRRWLEAGHDPEEITSTLFDFGILGNRDRSRWLFKYKDDDLAWSPGMKLIVHFGFVKKLRIRGPMDAGGDEARVTNKPKGSAQAEVPKRSSPK
jgi:hypothetical protein